MPNENQPQNIVRHLTNKGTSFVDGPVKKQHWMNKEFSDKERERLKLAGDLMILSAKGTTKIRVDKMEGSPPMCPKGYYISSDKGTCRRKFH